MRAPLVVLLTLALACGGGNPSPPPSPPPSQPAPQPTPSPTPPEPTPSNPTNPSNPTTPSNPAPSPSPSPSPSPTPTPPPASLVTFERLDGNPECDGLVPDRAPAPVTITRTPPPGYTCAGGTSDGTGHVAVAALIAGAPASWQVYAADGKARKAFDAWPVMPEPEGWQGLVVKPSTGANGGNLVQHAAFAADGSAGASTVVSWDPTLVGTTLWNASPDPLGGCLVVVAGIDLFHNHWSGLRAQRFDASGAPRWSTAGMFGARSDRILFLGGGVSRAGESLAIWQHSAWLDVSWFDASGTSLGESDFTERSDAVLGSNALQHDIDLVPLLDGGLAVHADGAFRSVYAHLATASAPLPSWLADHATWTYRFTRGNAGYALFPPPGQDSADCSQAIELYAPSGRRCGRVVLHGDGRSCSTGSVDQGWDGTVVQQEAAGACTYRFWPGLLAKP